MNEEQIGQLLDIERLHLSGGSVQVAENHTIPEFVLEAGLLEGNAVFTVASWGEWTGGVMSDVGVTSIDAGASFDIKGPDPKTLTNRTISNAGVLNWMDGNIYGGTGFIHNLVDAEFSGRGTLHGHLDNDGDLFLSGFGGLGTLSVNGNFSQTATGGLYYDLTSPTHGSDKLVVSGNVNLAGTLTIDALSGFAGDSFTLIDNTGSSAVSGTFSGLAEGDSFTLDGRHFKITYTGNDGNDVVLTDITTSTTLTSSQSPAQPGTSITFTATVTGNGVTPTGNVSFEEAGNVLGTGVLNTSGVATFTTTDLTSGSHNIIAVYEGDTVNAASSSDPYTQIVNGTPVATNDTYNMQQGGTLSVNAPGVLANDTDFENTPLAAFLVSQPAHGTVGLNADGSFVYQPDANYSGQDSFAYKVFDGIAYSNVATVTIDIEAIPAPTVTSISPTRGSSAGGTAVYIVGNSFNNVMHVKF